MRRWLISASVLLSSLCGTPCYAQGVIAERFHPAATSGGYLITERPETAGAFRLGVGLFTSYARSPLFLVAGPFSSPLINHMLSANVMASLGLWRFAEVALSLPVSLYQEGPGLNAPAAIGDLKLHLKGRIWTRPYLGFGLLGTFAFPTGDGSGYAGTGQVSFAPRFLMEGRVRWFRAGLNVGMLFRQGGLAGDAPISHELTYSAALGLRPHRVIELLGEVYGSTDLVAPFQSASMSPTEAGGATALHLWHFVLTAGGSAGIVNGYGAPAWRVFMALRFQQPPKPEPVLVRRPASRQPVTIAKAEPAKPRPVEVAPAEGALEPTTTFPGSAEIVVTATELIPKQAIFFKRNKARIQRDFGAVLNALATVLKDHPELGQIRIEGHTDATGRPSWNERLSRQRARAVYAELLRRGVDASRLTVVAIGPNRPIGDNNVEEGRSWNRRVVFHHAGDRKKSATRDGGL